MKMKQLITATVGGFMVTCLVVPGWAQKAASPAETRNLFETAGVKQTAKDFRPAPDKFKTHFGTLKFEGGAFPKDASVQKIYDEMDLQRATQAYMDFLPLSGIKMVLISWVTRTIACACRPSRPSNASGR